MALATAACLVSNSHTLSFCEQIWHLFHESSKKRECMWPSADDDKVEHFAVFTRRLDRAPPRSLRGGHVAELVCDAAAVVFMGPRLSYRGSRLVPSASPAE